MCNDFHYEYFMIGGENMSEYKHLKYIYEFGLGSDVHVSTPFVKDMSEIKTELIEQTPSKIVKHSKYPKGFEFLVEQFSDKVIYRTNLPLKEVRPNEYEIQFPS